MLFNPTDPLSAAYNPLLEVRRGSHEVRDVQNIADILVDPEGALERRNHWEKTSHALLVGAILHVLYAGEDKTLRGVANFLSDPACPFEVTLHQMMTTRHLGEGTHPVVASAAREVLNKSENERSGVLSTAMSFLGLYRDPTVAEVTSRCDWRIADLIAAEHPVSLYLVVPPSDNDAWNDRGSDFVAFREKNKGRLSQLTGASRHVSAVVMQIGQFFFVEFSGTGHACYVYKADQAPFNPDRIKLDLTTELKQQGRELKRMSHSPAPRRPNLVEGWLEKFDTELRELGIVPQSPSGHNEPRKAGSQSSIEIQVAAQLRHVNYQLMDNRSKGGALMVKLARDDARARVALARLGFKEMNKNPLTFWRS
nr:type IV secretory system conjugative DNA transfer family protein [Pseudomonas aeruginosa]